VKVSPASADLASKKKQRNLDYYHAHKDLVSSKRHQATAQANQRKEDARRRAIDEVIGYRMNFSKATERELDQWELVVAWASNKLDGIDGIRPPLPKRVLLTVVHWSTGRNRKKQKET
jgi:hypothetical protein